MAGLIPQNHSCCEPIGKRRSKGSMHSKLSSDQLLLSTIKALSIDAREALAQQAYAEVTKDHTMMKKGSDHSGTKNKNKKSNKYFVQANEALPALSPEPQPKGSVSSNKRRSSTRSSAYKSRHSSGSFSKATTVTDLDSGMFSITSDLTN